MHAWGVVDLRVYLAQKNHGYSISAQSYEFYLHLTQLDILEFTLSHMALNESQIEFHFYGHKALFDLSIIHAWEWWILGFIWPKKIMFTQYQPRPMIFVLT